MGQNTDGAISAKKFSNPEAFAETMAKRSKGNASSKAARVRQFEAAPSGYGNTPGQIANFPMGIAGAVTSPPYANMLSRAAGGPDTPAPDGYKRAGCGQKARYGATPGQIGEMPAGCVTSPPFLNSRSSTTQTGGKNVPQAQQPNVYGDTDGQIGNDAPETYWASMEIVYSQIFQLLRPGGVAAVVVKDFVQDKKRVTLCDDTLRLLMAIGFKVEARALCWMNVVGDEQHLLDGSTQKTIKVYKSFFRRMQESRGSPRIDHEEVLFVRRP